MPHATTNHHLVSAAGCLIALDTSDVQDRESTIQDLVTEVQLYSGRRYTELGGYTSANSRVVHDEIRAGLHLPARDVVILSSDPIVPEQVGIDDATIDSKPLHLSSLSLIVSVALPPSLAPQPPPLRVRLLRQAISLLMEATARSGLLRTSVRMYR